MVILIAYDLNKPGKDYSALYTAIRNISGVRWHRLSSVWLIETQLTPQQITQALKPFIDQNDELFVVRLYNQYDGYFPPIETQEARDWLRARMF